MNASAKHQEITGEGPIRAFFTGLCYPLRALPMLVKNFSILKFAIAPIMINVVVFITGLSLGYHYWSNFVSGLLRPENHAWYAAALIWTAYALAWVLGFVIYLLVCFLLFTFIGNLISAPFLDLVSERAEWVYLDKQQEAPFSLRLLLADLGMILMEEIRKFIIWLLFMICILPFLLVPLVGQAVFVALSTIFSVYFLGMAFVDFPLARRRQPFTVKRSFAWRVKYRLLGFGTAVYLTLIIPVIGFLCLPLSAVGGTLLFCDCANEAEMKFITSHSADGHTA